MYEYEEVTEQEAKGFAKEIGAIFQTTSAKLSNGVDELFKMIGKKFVNPDTENISNLTKEEAEPPSMSTMRGSSVSRGSMVVRYSRS